MGLNLIRWFHGSHQRRASSHKATWQKTPSRRLAVEPIETRLMLSVTFQSGMELVLTDNNISGDFLVIANNGDSGFHVNSVDSVNGNAISWQGVNDGSQVIISIDRPTTQNSSNDVSTNPPIFIRISDPVLPIDNSQTQMIDLALNADTQDCVTESDNLLELSSSSELVEDNRPAEKNTEFVRPSMTVEGARGRGQFFELAMASDSKPGLSSPQVSSKMLDKPAVEMSRERPSTTAFLPVAMGIRTSRAGTITRVPPPAIQADLVFSCNAPYATSHEDEGVLCASDYSRSPSHDSTSIDDELAVAALATQSGEAETDEPQHDAVFAELNPNHAQQWLTPLYLDKKSHVELAACLVAMVASGRVARQQEQQADPSGTYLLPHRRRDWWFKFH